MTKTWGAVCAQLAGFKQRDVTCHRSTRRCQTCHCTLPENAFTPTQLHRGGGGRCMMCVEIGPVVEACVSNRCAYCKSVTYDSLTKEHLIPKSAGGTWSPKFTCRGCNQEGGNDMAYEPYTTLVKDFPVLLDCANKRDLQDWRWKNKFLQPAVKTLLFNILKHSQSHKPAVQLIVSFNTAV